MEEFFLHTSDNFPLAVSLFTPEISNHKLVLINSATGVRQHIYFSFAKFLAQNGFTVITYDYRGIGLSKPLIMKGFKANMRTWGTKDYKTITDFIKRNYPSHDKYVLGHSVGALILGMNEDSQIFRKIVFVGTQQAFVGNLSLRTRIEAYLGFGIAQPLTTKLLGYFPAHWFGLGESLPSGSAFDWRTLILNKNSTNHLLQQVENFSKKLYQDVFVIRAEDDTWLTEKGVQKLLDDTYPNLTPKYRLVKTSESIKQKIGHINFFRSYNQNLWNIVLKEL